MAIIDYVRILTAIYPYINRLEDQITLVLMEKTIRQSLELTLFVDLGSSLVIQANMQMELELP